MHERVRERVILLLPLKLPGFGIELVQRCFNADTNAHAYNRSNSMGGFGATHATAPIRPDGETSDKGLFLCSGDEHGNIAAQGGDRRSVAAVRLQHNIAAAELSRAEGGLGSGGCKRHAAQRPTPTTGSWLHSYLILTLGPGAISQGRNVEKPRGTEQPDIAARGHRSRRGCKTG